MRIGVLALQGAFAEHEKMLSMLGAEAFEIRKRASLPDSFDGLIIPGGESTVQGKLLRELDLLSPIKSMISSGLPVFGTCAGLILLAKKTGDGAVYLDAMDIKAERNAYGRQLGSFRTKAVFDGIGEIEEVFIRAPYISEVWGDAKILSSVDGRIVAARQGKLLVTAFHPELTSDTRVHGCFLDMIRGDR
jgi:5'-phosphate synthase pdxT subunit